VYLSVIAILTKGELYEVGPLSILIENIVKGRIEKTIFILFLINLLLFIIRNRRFKYIPLFLLLLGIFISLNTRIAKEISAYEGDVVFLKKDLIWISPYSWSRGWKENRSYEYSYISFRLDKIDLMINNNMQPKSDNIFLLWNPIVYLRFKNGLEGIKVYPPKRMDGFFIHLIGVGPAPRIYIKDRHRNNIYDGYVMLRLLPVGMEDYFKIGSYKFYISISPASKVNNLLYRVRILRNELDIYEGIVKSGGKIIFDDKILELGDTKYFARISFVKDKGILIIFASILITLGYTVYWLVLKILVKKR
jgi:hypothetical protein